MRGWWIFQCSATAADAFDARHVASASQLAGSLPELGSWDEAHPKLLTRSPGADGEYAASFDVAVAGACWRRGEVVKGVGVPGAPIPVVSVLHCKRITIYVCCSKEARSEALSTGKFNASSPRRPVSQTPRTRCASSTRSPCAFPGRQSGAGNAARTATRRLHRPPRPCNSASACSSDSTAPRRSTRSVRARGDDRCGWGGVASHSPLHPSLPPSVPRRTRTSRTTAATCAGATRSSRRRSAASRRSTAASTLSRAGGSTLASTAAPT